MITNEVDFYHVQRRLEYWTQIVRANIRLFRTYDVERLDDGPALMFFRDRLKEAWRMRRCQQESIRMWKKLVKTRNGGMVELADTGVSKAPAEKRGGSSPSTATRV